MRLILELHDGREVELAETVTELDLAKMLQNRLVTDEDGRRWLIGRDAVANCRGARQVPTV